jgi:hypothetical protein
MEQARRAAQKRLERDKGRRRYRGLEELVRSSFRSRASSWLAIRVFDFKDWDPEHVQRWLVECGSDPLEAFEILYAARRKWVRALARENPNVVVPEPDYGANHRRKRKAFLRKEALCR